MQQSYLSKHSKNPQKLPSLNFQSKNPKNPSHPFHKHKQPTQQSLMLDIRDIDESLHNKNFMFRNGNLFSSEITDKLVTELYGCLKKKAIFMEDGFGLWGDGVGDGGDGGNTRRLTDKVETLNQRMAKLSMQNVYDYDLKKYMQIMKMNKNRWSLFKRVNENDPALVSKKMPTEISAYQLLQSSPKNTNHLKSLQSINQSISNNTSTIKPYINNANSKSRQSAVSTVSPLSKLSKLPDTTKASRIQSKQTLGKRKFLTEISELGNPEDQTPQISKYDIKNMLKKHGDNIIFMWLPPATYPQFHGMFTYVVTRKLTICRLKKYFFFRRSLNQRFFNSIIEQISSRQSKYIEGIEIITNKNDFTKVYEPINWKMKSMEGMDKIRIRYCRDQY